MGSLAPSHVFPSPLAGSLVMLLLYQPLWKQRKLLPLLFFSQLFLGGSFPLLMRANPVHLQLHNKET